MATVEIPITAGSQDLMVRKTATDYPPTAVVERQTAQDYIYGPYRYFVTPDYDIRNALLIFETGASLPDVATVTAAVLRIWVFANVTQATRSITADWRIADGTDADYVSASQTGAITAIAQSSITASALNDLALENVGDNVSTTGQTGIRLHISGDQPAEASYFAFASYENLDAHPPASLIVTYTVPTTRIAPDTILAQTNLTGAVSAIQDDPDAPDANWLTAP